MTVDEASLRDLGLLPERGGGAGGRSARTRIPAEPVPEAFGLLDHTHSKPARGRLVEHVRQPPKTLEELRRVQAAVRGLVPLLPDLTPYLLNCPYETVRKYFDSGLALSSGGGLLKQALEARSVEYRFPEQVKELRVGLEAVFELLGCAQGVAENLKESGGLTDQTFAFKTELERPPLPQIFRQRDSLKSTQGLLALDRLVRTEARAGLERLLSLILELDVLCSLAKATEAHGWAFPELGAEGLELEGLYHPQLARPVANDLHLPGGAGVTVVTGPNMGGKTTYLKSCALAVLLAHLGAGVPAKRATTPFFGALFCAVHIQDDLTSGESFF